MSARYSKYYTSYASGYTLIEILVALTIVGLLFSFGFVNFRDFSRRQQLSGIVKQIQGDLRLAEEDAITGQKPSTCGSAKTLESYGFEIILGTEYKINAYCSANTKITIKDVLLPPGITISTSSMNQFVKFKILGQGIDADSDWVLVITQTTTGNIANITVTSGGEIK